MRSRNARIGFFQFYPEFGKAKKNVETIVGALETVEADLMVLPELALTGYSFRDRREALAMAEDPSTSNSLAALADLCQRRDFHLVVGFAERQGERVFNSALLIGPGGVQSTYRKLHLFDREKDCFDPGDLPLSVVEVRGIRVGMMICFDWVFPEIARVLALQGAEVLCHPANLVLPYCQKAMTTRCLENRIFAVTANRYGREVRSREEITFTGRSQITAPDGSVLVRAPVDADSLTIMTINLEASRDKHLTDRNHLFHDRRPAFYAALCRKGDGSSLPV